MKRGEKKKEKAVKHHLSFSGVARGKNGKSTKRKTKGEKGKKTTQLRSPSGKNPAEENARFGH